MSDQDLNLYVALGVPGCAWGLVLLQTTAEYLVLTHRGLRSVPKSVAVVGPEHPDYVRADEVWQAAFAALRLASLPPLMPGLPPGAPPASPPASPPSSKSPAASASRSPAASRPARSRAESRAAKAPQTREHRLAAMRRTLRRGPLTLPELAHALGGGTRYARSLFKMLADTGEAEQVGDQFRLVTPAKRDAAASLERVREVLRDGPKNFAEVARATGLSATYSRRIVAYLHESGEARQVAAGKYELVA